MKIKILNHLFLLLAVLPVFGQTGPSSSGDDSLRLFAGSGENQILIHEINPLAGQITVISGDPALLEVKLVDHIPGQPLQLFWLKRRILQAMLPLTSA